jgi:serine/threonine protein kinase
MAASNSIDRQTFLAYLRQSGLVSDEQLADIARDHADQPRGRVIARALVEKDVLTRFQAERLLMGRTTGFLLGQYRILEQIGRGGMGRVYRAQHRTMHRLVALKVLSADLISTERAVELFLHEVRAIAQIVHPNIVTAFDANEINGRYYLVLEYVDGPNLDQLIRKQGPLTVGLACDYVRQVANGLQCAHVKGMVHRDIKPANLLVQWHGLNGEESPGLVKVSDFGLARLTHPIGTPTSSMAPGTIVTRENMVMGTPDYLSPEQSRNIHKTDIRSDLYSLGCTLHYLLTGSVPFPGGSAMDKLIRHATEYPQPVSDYRTDVPAAVLDILDKLLAKNPEDRFQTPAELAEALQSFAVSGPTPWAPTRPSPSSPFVDALSTPADNLTGETSAGVTGPRDPGGSDGDLLALMAPLSGGDVPIPANLTGPMGRINRHEQTARSRLRRAVVWAMAITAGLAAVAAALARMLL